MKHMHENISQSFFGFAKKFFDGVSFNFLIKLKGLISLPIIVNVLSKSDYGVFTLWFSLAGMMIGVFLLNLPDSSNRIILNFDKNKKYNLISETLSPIIIFVLIWTVILSLIVSFIYYCILSNPINNFLPILLVILFTKVMVKLSIFAYQIYQRTKVILISQIISEYISLIILICSVYLFDIKDLRILASTFVPFSIIISIFLIKKTISEFKLKFEFNKNLLLKTAKISLYLLPSYYLLILIHNIDVLMVKFFWTFNEVGEYGFSYSIATLITAAISSGISFFWISSAIYSNKSKLNIIINRIITFLPIFLIIIILFYFYSTGFIINIINSNYINTYSTIQILVVGSFFNASTQIFSGALVALFKERYILISNFIAIVINIILNIYLVPKYGINGAALSTSITYILVFSNQFSYLIFQLKKLKEFYVVLSFLILIAIAILYVSFIFINLQ